MTSGLFLASNDYLDGLALWQDEAAENMGSAMDSPSHVADRLWENHGAISGSSTKAVENAQAARRDACATLQRVSQKLAANLRKAATAYQMADEQIAVNLVAALGLDA